MGSVLHDGPLYVGMGGNVLVLYLSGAIDIYGAAVGLATYAFVGSFANWLHHAFHIEGHFVERFVYFHDLRALHYTHHQGTARHNYGFLDFSGDAVTGTVRPGDYGLSNPDHRHSERDKLGRGDEHRSRVKPGPPPTLRGDGPLECVHCGMCALIEGIVGLLGAIFGAATLPSDTGAAAVKAEEAESASWYAAALFQ